MIAKFKEDTGVTITPTLGDEIGMMTKMITGGNEIYDTVEENQFMTPRMLEAGATVPVPAEKIPNWALADAEWKDRMRSTAPTSSSTRSSKTCSRWCRRSRTRTPSPTTRTRSKSSAGTRPETSWALLYDRKYAGRVALGDFPTQSIANVLIYLSAAGKVPPLTGQATDPTREEIDRAIAFDE